MFYTITIQIGKELTKYEDLRKAKLIPLLKYIELQHDLKNENMRITLVRDNMEGDKKTWSVCTNEGFQDMLNDLYK